ncbi:cellulose biosynthesis protein BcsN [Ancylobacter sp. G4_0304]|uniref:cellulose biosynthesis protein BcsN n=1 Tax=Ancylobacter sp. G4_0304 TaxID=3114289 RepID=UPI0039C5DCB8
MTSTVEVPLSDAIVLPEPGAAPRVLAVLETRYYNAVEQEIALETNSYARGQNAFHAVFFGPVKERTGSENLRADDWLNEEVIDDEMTERMPGISMHVSNYFVQNRYGPFNYAMGIGGAGELCMYAWQRIQSQAPLYILMRDRGIIALRLRLCQVGATEQDLLRVMYRFSINAYFLPKGWQPYGRPLGEPEGIGRIGGPLAYPSGLQGDGTVLDGWLGPEPRATVAPAPRRSAPRPPRYGAPVAQPEQVYTEPFYQQPQGQESPLYPVEGYPQVPGPGVSTQLAPSATPSVVRGTPPAGTVVDPAPSRSVTTPSQNSPFSAPPTIPGLPSGQSPSTGTTGAPVRLVPGASSYPSTAN